MPARFTASPTTRRSPAVKRLTSSPRATQPAALFPFSSQLKIKLGRRYSLALALTALSTSIRCDGGRDASSDGTNLQDLSHHLSRLLQVTTNAIRSASFTS